MFISPSEVENVDIFHKQNIHFSNHFRRNIRQFHLISNLEFYFIQIVQEMKKNDHVQKVKKKEKNNLTIMSKIFPTMNN